MQVERVSEDLMTVGEVSKALGVNREIVRKFMLNYRDSTAEKLVGEHRLPYVEVGSKPTKMVRKADFEALKQEYQFGKCKQGAAPTRESLERYQKASQSV